MAIAFTNELLTDFFFSLNRYNTRSNKVRIIKTPGGELRYLHLKKKGTAPKCGDCGIKLPGVSTPWTSDTILKRLCGMCAIAGGPTERLPMKTLSGWTEV
jgi:hypothetical protein